MSATIQTTMIPNPTSKFLKNLKMLPIKLNIALFLYQTIASISDGFVAVSTRYRS